MGNAASAVAAKMAFFPPDPPTYEVTCDDDGRPCIPGVGGDRNVDVHVVRTRGGSRVVATFWRHPLARFTLLYSHGNAVDLGTTLPFLADLRIRLRANIVGYDYSGYGASSGKPSETNTYYDIEAVYNLLKREYGIRQEDLILYGQSIGSGPTLHLAAGLKKLRAVVLHSAMLSGLRVLYPAAKITPWFDVFKNIEKIRQVNCPVFVMHGTADEVVPWSHGKRLWELSREKYDPLWVDGAGHCNLESYPEYVRHLQRFVNAMERRALGKPPRKGSATPQQNQHHLQQPATPLPAVKHNNNRCLRF